MLNVSFLIEASRVKELVLKHRPVLAVKSNRSQDKGHSLAMTRQASALSGWRRNQEKWGGKCPVSCSNCT